MGRSLRVERSQSVPAVPGAAGQGVVARLVTVAASTSAAVASEESSPELLNAAVMCGTVAPLALPPIREVQVHAVVVKVKIRDRETAQRRLREEIVPRVSQSPGFVTGHWAWKDDSGIAMVVFDSEGEATAMSERVPGMIVEQEVTLEDVEVREIVANA